MRKSLIQLNLPRYCRELGVPVTSCPPFLFLVMGTVVIAAIFATYTVAQRYTEPEVAVLIALGLSAFLLIVGYLIVNAFEKLADSRAREQKQARELLALKDQFVFLAAHELRAPATAIKWAVESLETKMPELVIKSKEEIQLITQNTLRLLGIVHDVLETARIESQALHILLQPTAVGESLKRVFVSLQGLSETHGVKMVSKLEKNLPRVHADPLRLGEVFTNLLSNAVKFSAPGSVVEVLGRTTEQSVFVDVVDHGMGIAARDQPHIFEKFWRGTGTIEQEHSGLGLFIAKNLASLMGGTVRFVSEEGRGSTFTVELKRSAG